MYKWFRQLFGLNNIEPTTKSVNSELSEQAPLVQAADKSSEQTQEHAEISSPITQDVNWVAFDENLLERARTQWQFGDWQSLADIPRESLQHQPERAKLAVLVAAGHAQCGNTESFQQFIRLAKDWGCSRKLISQVLISGVQNSLGRASLAAGKTERAKLFFEQSVKTGMPGADLKLLSEARSRQQQFLLSLK